MEDPEQFDGLLMTVLQKGSGINNFFDSVYGFLQRKTYFFANQAESWNYIDTNYKKWLKKHQDKADREAKKKAKKEEEDRAKTKPAESSSATIKEITPEEYERRKQAERAEKEKQNSPESVGVGVNSTNISTNTSTVEPAKEEKEEDKIAAGKIRPSKEHGGTTKNFTWTQPDIKEVAIIIPVDSSVRGKQLTVKAEAKKLFVGAVGQPPLIDGELHALIKPDTLVWSLEEVKNGKIINITFEKMDTYKWWECVIVGDDCVDTTKIQPEATKLSDIDDKEMKAAVEKMMFDTRQKAMGLPTSDILQKNPMIEDFMKSHPEMDFSKAKFG
jgi:hypothetical protein